MPWSSIRPDHLDYDPLPLSDDAHHVLPSNVRIHDNLIQLLATLVGGGLGAVICVRRWQTLEAGLAGVAAGVVVAMLTASAVIRLIRR